MQPGDLLLVMGNTGWKHPFDDAIKLGEYLEEHESTTEHYSHVAIVLNDTWAVEAQGGRLSGKVRIEKYEGNYDIGHTNLSEADFERLAKACEAEFNLPYDWLSVCVWIPIGILFGYWRPYAERKTRYCATYVNDAFKAIGFTLSKRRLPTPDNVAYSPLVTIEKVG